MSSLVTRIGGVTVCWSVGKGFPHEAFDAVYGPFQVEAGQDECDLCLLHDSSWSGEDLADQGHVRFSAPFWRASAVDDGWHFLCWSSGSGERQRSLLWWPGRRQARLGIRPGATGSDPLGNVAFPFFTAFLADYRGVLVHAAAIEVDGRAWLFVGPSGSGKTHWTQHWLARGATILDEDRVVLREIDGQVWAFGTPWHAEPRLRSLNSSPLGRVFFLQQAAPDTFGRARPANAATLLLRALWLPVYDPAAMHTILDVTGQAVSQAELFLLGKATDATLVECVARI